jgi:hypothetical protein
VGQTEVVLMQHISRTAFETGRTLTATFITKLAVYTRENYCLPSHKLSSATGETETKSFRENFPIYIYIGCGISQLTVAHFVGGHILGN